MFLRAFLLVIAACSAVPARACSIPVFRYALDRWPADPYALEVSTDDAKEEAVARFLRNFTDSTPLNLAPTRLPDAGNSRLVFPHAAPGTPPVWSGKLDGSSLPVVINSPLRAKIAHRILSGESGVWVLVESGDRAVDDRAAAELEKRLRYLTQVAALPQIDPTDPTSRLGPGPALRVAFSLLRVRPDNAAELPFVKMLAGPKGAPKGPWIALVFGRGRVLGAWPTEGFGDEQIDEACLFLLGACSCQVKRMNPGWDLLLDIDWNEKLEAIGFPVAASEAAPARPANSPEAKIETVTINPSTTLPTSVPDPVAHGFAAPSFLVTISVLVLGGGLVGWFLRRQS